LTGIALVVSAIASGQGKTTVTAALTRHLVARGDRVRVFKAGADFLDAMLLERAAGHPVHVLDLWMVGEPRCRALIAKAQREADVVLIEGVMGLYDGTPSTADLARALDLPVLAVIDAHAMAQTAGAVAQGLRDFGPVHLAGVVANGVASDGHAAMVAASLRDIPLIATLPKQAQSLPERHLGLAPPDESTAIDALLDILGGSLKLDASAWKALLRSSAHSADPDRESALTPLLFEPAPLAGRRIAVARDAAFAFLYPANVDCLRELGAALSYFSPLRDETVPLDATAIYLPGGYPEMHAPRLSDATRFHDSMRAAQAAGLAILAECGGMMALSQSIDDPDGRTWPMTGILPGHTRMQPHLAAIGPQAWTTEKGELRGHTFHYSTLETSLAPVAHARSHPRGTRGEAIYRIGRLTASYLHAYFHSCPDAIAALFRGHAP
jgi:cobyrinic acid a,c-diamide synthase